MPRFRIAEIQSNSYAFSKTTALAFKSANGKTNEQRQNLRLPLLICVYFCGPQGMNFSSDAVTIPADARGAFHLPPAANTPSRFVTTDLTDFVIPLHVYLL